MSPPEQQLSDALSQAVRDRARKSGQTAGCNPHSTQRERVPGVTARVGKEGSPYIPSSNKHLSITYYVPRILRY